MRFHLKELSKHEQRQFLFLVVQAANCPAVDAEVRGCMLSDSFRASSSFDPMINVTSQVAEKVVDSISGKLDRLISVSYTHLTLPTTPYV